MLDEKLANLNPNNYAPRDAAIIRSWKDRVPALIAKQDWLTHPVTVELKAEIESRVRQIKERLGEDDNLSGQEEAMLRGEKRAMQFFMDTFNQNPDSELETIARAVDQENY